jgi:UDP-N-acetylmuramoylalanine--D-glutamate ligase
LILIAGGDAKGGQLEEFAAELTRREAVVIVLGRDREFIRERLLGVSEVRLVDTIEETVAVAAEYAEAGQTVLLAPACSSLDMFSSYGERGDRFAAAVRGMQT